MNKQQMNGVPSASKALPPILPNPEPRPRAKRRSFTAQYKLKILAEVDAATGSGAIGALLRREGVYSSMLTN